MRDLLKHYADRGGTVLLSSHLLNEVELIADEMILIGRGRIVAQGNKKALLAERASGTLVTAVDNKALETALIAAGLTVNHAGEGLRVDAETLQVGQVAADKQIVLTDLRPADGGLENLFLELTSESQRDDLTHTDDPDGAAA
jgi:ABC-2 type transport system ATP-binding protein